MFSEAPNTTIDLIRHGEPQGGRKFRGAQDDPLSASGWQQMRAVLGQAAPWQRIITSPLRRCSAFAQMLAARHQLPLHIESEFREIHFGQWEGLDSHAVMQRWPDLLNKIWRDSLVHTPPDGEPLIDFSTRVAGAWDIMLAQHSGEHLLVVAHGGTIRMIICHTLGLSLAQMWCFDVQYASLSRLRAWHREDGGTHYSLISHAAPLRKK